MVWALFALIGACFQVLFIQINRRIQGEVVHLNFMHVLGGLLLTACFLPLAIIPTHPAFYIGVLANALIGLIGCVVQMRMSQSKNGRVASMWMPVSSMTGFFIWMCLDPGSFQYYLDNPLTLAGILTAFVLCTHALSHIRRNDAGWRAFVIVAPVGIMYGLYGVITKLIMPEQAVLGDLLGLVFFYCLFSTLLHLGYLMARHDLKTFPITKPFLARGLMAAFCSIMTIACVAKATVLVDNPGYIGAIMMTVPVWIMVYHKITKMPDDADPKSGVLMVLGALLLVFATSL